ncbi:MAG TPA: hypothetical protein DCY35_06800 [Prolixibacteraceae bacterium]|nr:hypothetical protein [Prolixibacteraceae bacterium]
MTTNRKSHGEILSDIRWQGGTVTNDRDMLEAKGINGLNRSEAYAVAINKTQKIELWFRSEERLLSWYKTIDKTTWNIKFIRNGN